MKEEEMIMCVMNKLLCYMYDVGGDDMILMLHACS